MASEMNTYEFVAQRADRVVVGDVIQHPVYPARWLHVEWVGKNLSQSTVHIAGWFAPAEHKEDQREAVELKPSSYVLVWVNV